MLSVLEPSSSIFFSVLYHIKSRLKKSKIKTKNIIKSKTENKNKIKIK